VPRFEPFTGLRYSHSHVRSLDDVVCPPYDVISESERTVLEGRSPNNVVRLELPHDNVEPGDTHSQAGAADRYELAARLLDAWRDGGVLHRDAVPAFYGYRMSFTDPSGQPRRTVGVMGALGLEPPGSGILPHEETTPKAKTDRLDLLRATRANLSPIWGLTPASGLSSLAHPPEHAADHATDPDRVLHELWPITEPEHIGAIRSAVKAQPVLIADGHHRFETAINYQRERAESGTGSEADGFILALIVELSPEQLTVQAIHRLISGLPSGFDLPSALDEWFDVTPTGPPDRTILTRMEDAQALALLTPQGAWLARPRESVLEKAAQDLDSSRLDVALAQFPDHQLTFQHGWGDCAAAVAVGQADVAVLLRPAAVKQITEIARGGVRMPPKTTFFWPKPRTGMVIRELIG
jgi:uncharacterized protein (DUF1015 family)